MLHQKPIGEEEAAQATSHVERQLLLCHHPVQCESIMGSQSEEKSIFLKASFQSLGIGLYGSIGLGRLPPVLGSTLRLWNTSDLFLRLPLVRFAHAPRLFLSRFSTLPKTWKIH